MRISRQNSSSTQADICVTGKTQHPVYSIAATSGKRSEMRKCNSLICLICELCMWLSLCLFAAVTQRQDYGLL